MLPIKFLNAVVDMRIRCKSNGQDYPPDIPLDITKVLELNMASSTKSQNQNIYFSLVSLTVFDFEFRVSDKMGASRA